MPEKKHHILVVEDEPVSREMLADFLKKEGFLVSKAKNGLQMKSVLVTSRVRVDLVLLDIGLPGKDGIQLAKELRSRSDVGIIFVTGKTSKETRIEGLETGGDDYITKPYDEQELLARSHAVIRRSTAVSAHSTQENFTDLTPREIAESEEDALEDDSKTPLPVNIVEFINTSGRLSFVDLQSIAQRHSKRIFSRLLVRPVLKGVGLVSGIATDEMGGDGSTKLFRLSGSEEEHEIKTSKAAAETIYPFIKRVGSTSPGFNYSAGRTFDNDIIIPDFAVSEKHADFFIKADHYSLTDCGSVNGTAVDGVTLASGEDEVMLQDGAKIRIGRFLLTFLMPDTLYDELSADPAEDFI
ncbi:MAG: response regulator [Nitrospinaceae bacterium]|jgi:DNA-binding response OmpR family regulator|nr:response regulator [Nitrospinaceae bacterium]MBT3433266.1 response regulator [Nitrospinaceae bacterium]MBT3823288.1 response regulator [Nitrospinaceae bacterium]MBT4092993.1 response regulator [Nitrospinaceae bacterium]MBT4432635.1 response regulator [Nitrospinaceae bacterium]